MEKYTSSLNKFESKGSLYCKSGKNELRLDLGTESLRGIPDKYNINIQSPDSQNRDHFIEFTKPSPAKYLKHNMNNLSDEEI